MYLVFFLFSNSLPPSSYGFSILSFNHPRTSKTTFHRLSLSNKTDDIGKTFSFQLAQKDLHLIFVNKNLSKLKEVPDEIVSVHATTKINVHECWDSQDLDFDDVDSTGRSGG